MQKLVTSIVTSIAAVLIASTLPWVQRNLNIFFMKFFRDVARVKARNRRMNNGSLITMNDLKAVLMDREEDPLHDLVDQIMNDSNDMSRERENGSLPMFSREELSKYNMSGDIPLLYLSVLGRVYDVTAGVKHYGPGGKYHSLAGRDVTKSLATGCLRDECLGSMTSLDTYLNGTFDDMLDFELNEKTLKEAKKWLAFFETHDKYMFVGHLKDSPSIEGLIEQMIEKELDGEAGEKVVSEQESIN